MRSAKFFRIIWRLDAILILLIAAAALFGVISLFVSEIRSNARQREAAAAAPPVAANAEKNVLRLGGLAQIEGTTVFRASLTSRKGGGVEFSSSGGYENETHNILFIDAADGNARWLLPSNHELITFDTNVSGNDTKGPIATVVLVDTGRLLLFDPAAKHINEVATGVHDVDGVTLMSGGPIAVLYESNRRYHLATFDRASLAKISEREVNVPQLK
jgi:hypothetical protein